MKKKRYKEYKGHPKNGPVKIIKAKPTVPKVRNPYIPAVVRRIMREE